MQTSQLCEKLMMIKTSVGEEMTGSVAAWLKSRNTFDLVTALIIA